MAIKNRSISLRLSEEMLEALEERAIALQCEKTEIIRNAIGETLRSPERSISERLRILEKEVRELKYWKINN